MTVEDYLRGLIPKFSFDTNVLESAVLSPKLEGFPTLSLDDDWDVVTDDEELVKSLKYASATLYYSAANTISGGSRTEQVGDVRTSESNFNFSWLDRLRWWKIANKLREELGLEPEEELTDTSSTMYDATSLAKRPKWQ